MVELFVGAVDSVAHATRRLTPTLDDFDLSAYSGGLCVSMASPVDAVIIIGSSALILGAAALAIGQVLKRRA